MNSNSNEDPSLCGSDPRQLETIEQLTLDISRRNWNRQKINLVLVGETGVGKTMFLSFLANVLAGRSSQRYQDAHDPNNEAGGSPMDSQTNAARMYEFTSGSGTTLRVLDTPGFADTRGPGYDEDHTKSIMEALHNHFDVVDAVIILVNGTSPRLNVTTDYALTTLLSILPRKMTTNLGLVAAHVPNRLCYNFDPDSLAPFLCGVKEFYLDNPVALQRKYLQVSQQDISLAKIQKIKDGVRVGEESALNMLMDLFGWIDVLSPQPTQPIWDLYQQSRAVEAELAKLIPALRVREGVERLKNVQRSRMNDPSTASLQQLLQAYGTSSLGGSFMIQVQKSTRLLETALEALQQSGVDRKVIIRLENSLEDKNERLNLLESLSPK